MWSSCRATLGVDWPRRVQPSGEERRTERRREGSWAGPDRERRRTCRNGGAGSQMQGGGGESRAGGRKDWFTPQAAAIRCVERVSTCWETWRLGWCKLPIWTCRQNKTKQNIEKNAGSWLSLSCLGRLRADATRQVNHNAGGSNGKRSRMRMAIRETRCSSDIA